MLALRGTNEGLRDGELFLVLILSGLHMLVKVQVCIQGDTQDLSMRFYRGGATIQRDEMARTTLL